MKAEPAVPAVSIKKSITPDFIICLDDGKKFKSLKRHQRTTYDMTPEQYRAKWSLPKDYPMVAPNYTAARSELANRMGLGQQRRKSVAKGRPRRLRLQPSDRSKLLYSEGPQLGGLFFSATPHRNTEGDGATG